MHIYIHEVVIELRKESRCWALHMRGMLFQVEVLGTAHERKGGGAHECMLGIACYSRWRCWALHMRGKVEVRTNACWASRAIPGGGAGHCT